MEAITGPSSKAATAGWHGYRGGMFFVAMCLGLVQRAVPWPPPVGPRWARPPQDCGSAAEVMLAVVSLGRTAVKMYYRPFTSAETLMPP